MTKFNIWGILILKKKTTITIDDYLFDLIYKLAVEEHRSFSQQICKLAEDKLNECLLKKEKGK